MIMSLQRFDDNQEELEIARWKVASLEASLQFAKDSISCLERDLRTLNSRFGWFKYKLRDTECKLGTTKFKASRLEEVTDGLIAEVEFLRREVV